MFPGVTDGIFVPSSDPSSAKAPVFGAVRGRPCLVVPRGLSLTIIDVETRVASSVSFEDAWPNHADPIEQVTFARTNWVAAASLGYVAVFEQDRSSRDPWRVHSTFRAQKGRSISLVIQDDICALLGEKYLQVFGLVGSPGSLPQWRVLWSTSHSNPWTDVVLRCTDEHHISMAVSNRGSPVVTLVSLRSDSDAPLLTSATLRTNSRTVHLHGLLQSRIILDDSRGLAVIGDHSRRPRLTSFPFGSRPSGVMRGEDRAHPVTTALATSLSKGVLGVSLSTQHNETSLFAVQSSGIWTVSTLHSRQQSRLRRGRLPAQLTRVLRPAGVTVDIVSGPTNFHVRIRCSRTRQDLFCQIDPRRNGSTRLTSLDAIQAGSSSVWADSRERVLFLTATQDPRVELRTWSPRNRGLAIAARTPMFAVGPVKPDFCLAVGFEWAGRLHAALVAPNADRAGGALTVWRQETSSLQAVSMTSLQNLPRMSTEASVAHETRSWLLLLDEEGIAAVSGLQRQTPTLQRIPLPLELAHATLRFVARPRRTEEAVLLTSQDGKTGRLSEWSLQTAGALALALKRGSSDVAEDLVRSGDPPSGPDHAGDGRGCIAYVKPPSELRVRDIRAGPTQGLVYRGHFEEGAFSGPVRIEWAPVGRDLLVPSAILAAACGPRLYLVQRQRGAWTHTRTINLSETRWQGPFWLSDVGGIMRAGGAELLPSLGADRALCVQLVDWHPRVFEVAVSLGQLGRCAGTLRQLAEAIDEPQSDEHALLSRCITTVTTFGARRKLPGLSLQEHVACMRLVSIIGDIHRHGAALDLNAARYLVHLHAVDLSAASRATSFALHSTTQEMLANALAPPGKMTWKHARHSRMFRWIRSQDLLRSAMENVARAEYGASEARDPTACSIFYTALRRKTLLVGLWRTAYGHPDRNNVLKFITNDFDDPRWRTAAQKNAYVLMSKQRFSFATSFFLLADRLQEAVDICLRNLKDVELAIAVARVYEGERGPVLGRILREHVLPVAWRAHDRWGVHWVCEMLGLRDLGRRALAEPLSRVVRDIAPERDLPTADAPVTGGSDPYLAILSTQLRAHANDGGGDSADDISLLACAAREFWESGCQALVPDFLRHVSIVAPEAPAREGALTKMRTADLQDRPQRKVVPSSAALDFDASQFGF